MAFAHSELLSETERLKSFAYKLSRNRSDAEDLLQDTLLRALEKRDQFQKGTNLFGWTSKIMFNLFATSYRRKVKSEIRFGGEEIINSLSIEAAQEAEMEVSNLRAALERLSEDHREILVMVCVHGMTYEDVSEKLGIPVGTVRSRLFRARANLKDMVEKNLQNTVVAATALQASNPLHTQ
jgi:RNA polymerase sigma-70 factor, ECF subfamily